MWMSMKPNTAKFRPGQVASYAHKMACHAALRTRRDLELAVRLPGSAFRKKADGDNYVTPGVLADSLQWEDLEAWFQTDDLADAFQFSEAPPEMQMQESQEDPEKDPEMERLALIERHRDEMTPRQLTIIQRLVEGKGYDAIMLEVDIKKSTLLRELAIITEIISQPVNEDTVAEA